MQILEMNVGDHYPDPTTGMGNELISLWSVGLQIDSRQTGTQGNWGWWSMGYWYGVLFGYHILFYSVLPCLDCLVIGRQASTGGQYIVINGTPYKPASLPYAAIPVQ